MDPVTHGLTGAAAALLFSDKEHVRPAALAGALSAMSADLDIFIASQSDPLLNLEMHRQFTHAFIFIPVGSLLISALLFLFLKRTTSFKKLYLFSFAGLCTAGLLDACTSYGTQLLWPFLDTRISWSVVSILDPVITAGLILFVLLGVIRKDKRYGILSLSWILIFLAYGWFQQNRAEKAASVFAAEQQHTPTEFVVKPTLGNQLLWRVNYMHNGRIYAIAVRAGIFSDIRIYQGGSSPLIIPEKDFAEYAGTTLFEDIKRFETLSDGYLVRHPEQPNVIGDARFSMLPDSMTPLWGIKINTQEPGQHPEFLYFRDSGPEVRDAYVKML
ncbi:MAG: metal-dependent hydrolase, partial [Balneolaceae bacterium]|nr:metal-dependent hydrolase [Balneolaceae bacterium]